MLTLSVSTSNTAVQSESRKLPIWRLRRLRIRKRICDGRQAAVHPRKMVRRRLHRALAKGNLPEDTVFRPNPNCRSTCSMLSMRNMYCPLSMYLAIQYQPQVFVAQVARMQGFPVKPARDHASAGRDEFAGYGYPFDGLSATPSHSRSGDSKGSLAFPSQVVTAL